MKAVVVIPTYQEAENIEQLLRAIRTSVPDTDVLIIDDGSPDGTASMARSLGSELGRIEIIERGEKLGLGSAYRTGFGLALEAGYDVIAGMDADLSHDPTALGDLFDAVRRGADLAVGSRYVPGGRIPDWPVARRALSRFGNRYAAAMLRMGVADATTGYRAYRADLLVRLDLANVRAEGYGFLIELTYRTAYLGRSIVEVPITFVDRTHGTSKMSTRIILEAFALVTLWGIRDRVVRSRRTRRVA